MATTKSSKSAPAKSSKKTVTKAPARTVVKPQPPKKGAAAKKAASRTPGTPARSVKKPLPGKPATAAKPKDVKKLTAQTKPAKNAAPTPAAAKAAASPASAYAPKAAPKAAAANDPKKPRFSKSDLEQFKIDLLAMRDRITGQSGAMRTAALQRNDETNPEEDGTDAFMRLQTLEQVSSQQQIIANIDEALHAIEKGSYGICDMCSALINKPRLSVLPFAKNCITCQSEVERAHRPGGRR